MPGQLKIFDVCRNGTHVLGPGCRYVVWTQGCKKSCKGCITPESRELNAGVEIDVTDLAADIILNPYINGITISGGEPFLQAESLAIMLDRVLVDRPELTTIIYTGYQYEELLVDYHARHLISLCDLIIDGEYIEKENDGVGIRGSANQRFIRRTNRLDDYLQSMSTGLRHQQLVAKDNTSFTKIGIPQKNMV